MKHIQRYSIVLLTLSIICFAIIAGCDSSQNSPEKKEMAKEFASRMKELISKPNQEAIALLSVKYKMDANTLEKLIGQYLMETDFSYRIINQTKDNQRSKHDIEIATGILNKATYIELINQISMKYSLEPSLVATILFDYILWDTAKEGTESNSSGN